jgi:glycerophosphoryl diester phosphodiesterase
MPLLSEVFDLVDCYEANQVVMNVETKVEAGAPQETAPREQFVQVVAREVRKAHMLRQVTIQSFDWGALMRMRQVEPRLPIVALTNGDFLQVGQPGASPWLGGIDIDDFGGSLVAGAASFGADAISPVHGNPQGGKIGDPGYVPYTTPELVAEAHAAGIAVIPWTIDDPATMNYLIDAGVDGIITDYPDRLREVVAARGFKLPSPCASPGIATASIDLYAHAMDEDALNMSVRKYLKKLGVTSQREIETAVREQVAAGRLRGDESLDVSATVSVQGLTDVVVTGKISLA